MKKQIGMNDTNFDTKQYELKHTHRRRCLYV